MLLTDTIISSGIGLAVAVATWFLERKNQALAVKNSEDRLRICQHFGGVGLWEADLINRHISSISCPDNLDTQLIKDLAWQEFLDTVHIDDRKILTNAIQAINQRNLSYQVEYRGLTDSQQMRWLRSVGQVDCDSFGKPLKIRGVLQDVTERKAMEERLRLSEQVFSLALEGMVITDAKAFIVDVNPAFCQLTGYSREEILGQQIGILKSDRYDSDFYSIIWQAILDSGNWQGELWFRKKSEEVFLEFLAIYALHDTQGKLINCVGLLTENSQSLVTPSMSQEKQHYDPLTQLLDRVLFSDRFAQALAHSKRFNTLTAICYLDLDGFKRVNDSFGCQIGDRLLIEVAKRIKFNLREGDSICRMGGDKFALLFENLQSLPQCIDTLNRIHLMLAAPLAFDDQKLQITASSGVTIYPLDKEEPDILLSHADAAMQQAKAAGRNCYRFYANLQQANPALTFPASSLGCIESIERKFTEIEQALQSEQFCLYYQPKVNIKTGETLGAEALLRWRHPDRGLLTPGEFLPVIAETDMEVKLGVWVINQALQQLSIWQELGLVLQISVNVSAHFLLSAGFVAMLGRELSKFPAISAKQLELELLEGKAPEDMLAASNILKECYAQLGVLCAMDGFGAGYAALPLARQPIPNTVKIEQNFVRNMIDNPDDLAIIEGVIARSKSLKQISVAEGVETLEHGLYLIALGCSIAQGFGIAQPMPATALMDWIISYQNPSAWLERGKIQLSVWQTELELLKIQQKHWFVRLQNCLDAPIDGDLQWPLIDQENSHLGKWLSRIKNQQFFDRRLFDRLQEFHSQQHNLAQQLIQKRQEGKREIEALGCKQLLSISEEIEELLQQFELFG
jgi:diguanylate cyclase (GGDEF)-like protein/PAS domain S-box-containing protein